MNKLIIHPETMEELKSCPKGERVFSGLGSYQVCTSDMLPKNIVVVEGSGTMIVLNLDTGDRFCFFKDECGHPSADPEYV